MIAAFVQDKTAIERGIFDEELVPEELTQVRMGKIIKDKYPELDEEDQEAVRQHAIAALNLTQTGQAGSRSKAARREAERQHRLDRRRAQVCDGRARTRHRPHRPDQSVRRSLCDPRQDDERGEPETGAAAIAAKRTSLTPEEAKELAVRAVKFKKERGRLPSISSPDAWEKRMAEGAAAFVRFKDEGRYE